MLGRAKCYVVDADTRTINTAETRRKLIARINETLSPNHQAEARDGATNSSTATDSPLPWKITSDGRELDITDANGNRVIYGNVNRGIEYDDPKTTMLLERAIEWLNHKPTHRATP